MKRGTLLLCEAVGLAVIVAWTATSLAAQDTGDELSSLVITLLRDKDKDMRALGLEQVRTQAKGRAATRQFAELLPQLPPEVQAGLLRALAERGDAAARPAILELIAASQEESVRVEAIRALGFLGTPDDLSLLVRLLSKGQETEKAAARSSLAILPGEVTSRAIAAEMNQATAAQRVTLIEILVARRAFDSAADLLPAAADADASVRVAAMAALGQLASAEHVAGMVQGILKAEKGREREAAEKAVMLVCQRDTPAEHQANPLAAALDNLNQSDTMTVLPTLGRVGGPAALKTVKQAIDATDRKMHEAGLRALCNWPDASVAPDLIELVKTDEHAGDQIAALRALIRVAPLPDGRSDGEKLDLLKEALSLCTRDNERKYALQRAAAIRIPETLRFLLPFLDQPAYAQAACESIVELAHDRTLREPNKSEFDKALDKVLQTSKDDTVIDRANRYKRGQTWVRPRAAKSP